MIYHFCPRADWEAAGEVYAAPSLARQGFVHCSPRDHVHVPATALAAGRTDLVVLEIDESRLSAPAVWEEGDPPHPDGRLFPHVYGPIPVSAVVSVVDLPPRLDGTFAPLP
ncbi:DUF952 domain-containing protein [Mangrovihabitans endophyticus]|uniref:Glutathione S-transferase n=1 Tax=Mangrovihabitans endophyticus TaxID=1751298 RepID=A0A8J3C536_9ACTN|nr:DUF952 domain-containing protein [Mangrovihabitans endophyticus]GGL10874.1 glutathione S-transferase [Mangrovihabitans endophyticus]